MRTITYAIASEDGRYNQSFLWSNVQSYLDFMSIYFPIQFVRINDWNGARYRILQARGSLNRNAFAETSASLRRTRISMTANYQSHNYLCAKVLMHEFGHCLQTGFVHLSGSVDLMSETTGNSNNFTERDCVHFFARAYGYKSSLRPWIGAERDRMRQTFMPPQVRVAAMTTASMPPEHEASLQCECRVEATKYQRWLEWSPSVFKRWLGLVP